MASQKNKTKLNKKKSSRRFSQPKKREATSSAKLADEKSDILAAYGPDATSEQVKEEVISQSQASESESAQKTEEAIIPEEPEKPVESAVDVESGEPASESQSETIDPPKESKPLEEQLSTQEVESSSEPLGVNQDQESLVEQEETLLSKYLWKAIIVVLIIGIIVGAFVVFRNKIPWNRQIQASPSPAAIVQTDTEGASEELDKSQYPLVILNGSGIEGEATRVKNVLESAGFMVSEVGNAERYDFAETIIRLKGEIPDLFLNELKGELEKNYSLGNTEELSTGEESIIIVIGSKKAQ